VVLAADQPMLYSLSMTRSQLRIIATAAAVLLLAAAIVAAGLRARELAATAANGKSQAEAGARSLAALDATAAVGQFSAASRSFASLSRSLGPGWVSGAVGRIPW
jgi:hypothetical protein